MKKNGQRLFVLYSAITLALVGALLRQIILHGSAGFHAFQRSGHASSLAVNFAVCCLSWLMLGGILFVLRYPSFVKRHVLFLIAFVLIAFSYMNTIREPHAIGAGDFAAYYRAAACMARDVPIEQSPDRLYLYPPLMATLMMPLARFDLDAAARLFHLLNYAAVLALALLLYLALQRYRFSRELAALSLLAILAANVPVSRTLIYHQVNLHVLNLMLLSLLLSSRIPWGSALALTLAIHLKVYPLFLVLPFLHRKQWRWCTWFALSNLAIILATSLISHPRYYLQFLHQVSDVTETALRNVSVNSFLYNTMKLAGMDFGPSTKAIALAVRLLMAGAAFAAYARMARRNTPDAGDSDTATQETIATGFIVLPVAMLAISPSVWPHHFVLWILTMPVLAGWLRRPWELALLGLSYLILFLFPVYDIYPLSYLRLAAMAVILVLLHAAVRHRRSNEPPSWAKLQERLMLALS